MRLYWLFPLSLATAVGCGQAPTPQPTRAGSPVAENQMVIKPGGLYSVKSGDGGFSIVKVLVVEDGGVHARLHKNRYKERPTTIDPKELQVAIGHVPLSEAGFRSWEPVLLLEQAVTESELEGYRLWKER